LAAETHQLATRLSHAPPISIGGSKQAVYQTESATLDAMLDYELEAQLRCFRSQDMKEGLRAFLEKRAPKFTGQ
jgi:enoyl-CoA hydratase/carnithine racemase